MPTGDSYRGRLRSSATKWCGLEGPEEAMRVLDCTGPPSQPPAKQDVTDGELQPVSTIFFVIR
jgi:hypothetical protein